MISEFGNHNRGGLTCFCLQQKDRLRGLGESSLDGSSQKLFSSKERIT